jgi:general secretion pathway protein C
MLTAPPSRWTVQGLTFLLWGLAAAAAVYWGLKLGAGTPAPAAADVSARPASLPDPAAVARLLGAGPGVSAAQAPTLASRFSLLGVAAQASGAGVALISVDGKPAKPFRVGSAVDEGLLLQSVEGRTAVLAASLQGPPVLTLELPRPRQGATAQPS